jgi:hypothetical protein
MMEDFFIEVKVIDYLVCVSLSLWVECVVQMSAKPLKRSAEPDVDQNDKDIYSSIDSLGLSVYC